MKHIRKELQSIRNRVNHLLDHLELSSSASIDECASDAGRMLRIHLFLRETYQLLNFEVCDFCIHLYYYYGLLISIMGIKCLAVILC